MHVRVNQPTNPSATDRPTVHGTIRYAALRSYLRAARSSVASFARSTDGDSESAAAAEALRNMTMPPALESTNSERGIILQVEGGGEPIADTVPQVDEDAGHASERDRAASQSKGSETSRRDSMVGLAHTYADLLMQKEGDIQEQQDEIQALRRQLGAVRDKVGYVS